MQDQAAANEAILDHAYQCARHGRWKEAQALYEWHVDRFPRDLTSRLGLAHACLALRQPGPALAALEPVRDSASAAVHLLRSRALTMDGQTPAACVEFALFATLAAGQKQGAEAAKERVR